MDTLTFNGRAFSDFNTFFDGSKSFGSPEQDIEFVEVPGRNGSMSLSNQRFHDITLTFPCFIRGDFVRNYRDLSQYLNSVSGFHRLECSKEPDYYRMAAFVGGIEPTTTAFNKSGFFDIPFRCHPQRFLKSGDTFVQYTANGSITNPTLFASKPLLRIYGVGSAIVNNVQITISDASTYTDIDCDLMECRNGSLDLSEYVVIAGNNFPTLHPGDNQIQLGAGITQISVKPRWFAI